MSTASARPATLPPYERRARLRETAQARLHRFGVRRQGDDASETESRRNDVSDFRAGRFVPASCLAASALAPLLVLFAIARFGVNVPYGDEWRWADMVVRFDAGTLTFAELWYPDHEHRVLFPSLIALALSRAGGWNTVREVYFSFACALATQFAYWRLLRATLPPNLVLPALAAGSLLLFSTGQSDNWIWGFQLAWFVINLSAFLAIVALAREQLDGRAAALAGAAAVVAAFSSAHGLAVAIPGLVMLVARRPLPRRALLAWVATYLVLVGVYLWGLPRHHFPSSSSPGEAALYACVLLGAPLVTWTNALVPLVLVGLSGWLACLGATVDFARARLRNENVAARAPWVALMLFGATATALIASGRVTGGLPSATATRYVTLTSLVWIGIVAWSCVRLGAAGSGRKRRALVALLLAGCGALVIESAFGIAILRSDRNQLRDQSAIARRVDSIPDRRLVEELFSREDIALMHFWQFLPQPEDAPGILRALRRDREGPFAGR